MNQIIPVYTEEHLLASCERQYESELGVRYLSQLEFSSPYVRRSVLKRTEKALRKGKITTRQKWLAAFFKTEIDSCFTPPISIHWIGGSIGFGVFAEKPLAKMTYIGEYTGLLRRRKWRADKHNSYTFEYLIGETIDTPFTIDAKHQGNHTRFINHDAEGNCDPMLIYKDKMMRVIIYTNRFIEAGEQLTYDYGTEYWANRENPEDLFLGEQKDAGNVSDEQRENSGDDEADDKD